MADYDSDSAYGCGWHQHAGNGKPVFRSSRLVTRARARARDPFGWLLNIQTERCAALSVGAFYLLVVAVVAVAAHWGNTDTARAKLQLPSRLV